MPRVTCLFLGSMSQSEKVLNGSPLRRNFFNSSLKSEKKERQRIRTLRHSVLKKRQTCRGDRRSPRRFARLRCGRLLFKLQSLDRRFISALTPAATLQTLATSSLIFKKSGDRMQEATRRSFVLKPFVTCLARTAAFFVLEKCFVLFFSLSHRIEGCWRPQSQAWTQGPPSCGSSCLSLCFRAWLIS